MSNSQYHEAAPSSYCEPNPAVKNLIKKAKQKYFLFYFGFTNVGHLFDHLLWSVFQSVLHTMNTLNFEDHCTKDKVTCNERNQQSSPENNRILKNS